MLKITSIKISSRAALLLSILLILAVQFTVVAAVGDDNKKKKKGVVLRVEGFDLNYFGKSPLNNMYKRPGSFYTYHYTFVDKAPQSAELNEVHSFKRGSTIYLVPQKPNAKIPLSKFKVPEKPRN